MDCRRSWGCFHINAYFAYSLILGKYSAYELCYINHIIFVGPWQRNAARSHPHHQTISSLQSNQLWSNVIRLNHCSLSSLSFTNPTDGRQTRWRGVQLNQPEWSPDEGRVHMTVCIKHTSALFPNTHWMSGWMWGNVLQRVRQTL